MERGDPLETPTMPHKPKWEHHLADTFLRFLAHHIDARMEDGGAMNSNPCTATTIAILV